MGGMSISGSGRAAIHEVFEKLPKFPSSMRAKVLNGLESVLDLAMSLEGGANVVREEADFLAQLAALTKEAFEALPGDAAFEDFMAKRAELERVEILISDLIRFAHVADPERIHWMCNLEVQEGILPNGDTADAVSFVLPKNVSFGKVLKWAEDANPRDKHHGVVDPHGELQKDPQLTETAATDTRYQVILCRKSGELGPYGEREEYLRKNGLKPVRAAVLTAAAAIYRDRKGFPPDNGDVGSMADRGDLFFGGGVRLKKGLVRTATRGIALLYDHGIRSENIILAGEEL